MSLKIIKAGLLDTVQDLGRWGHQHLGINPGGAMDRFSAGLANALLGKELASAVLELHFPAAEILFQKATVICMSGADFSPQVNGEDIALNQPFLLKENSLLRFRQRKSGVRCYLAVLAAWQLEPWLHSFSTNLKAGAGGCKGRSLGAGDEIAYAAMNIPKEKTGRRLPWQYPLPPALNKEVAFTAGPEWDWLGTRSQTVFLNHAYRVTPASDRMGYRLQGESLEQEKPGQLLSSGVNFGTVQLLPNGQTIVLMADHQTTGGYPRIATVISTDLPALAQLTAGEEFRFALTTVDAAEKKYIRQQERLHDLQNTCKLKIENWLQQQA